MIDFTIAQFSDLIVTQRICVAFVTQLENQFKRFKQQLITEHKLREIMQQMDDYISFDNACSTISLRYPWLCNIFGGLVSIFLGTNPVESDFSLIGFEKDNYHSSLTNFSLKAIELLRKISNLID